MEDIERSTVVLAITGGIACGKSEVGRVLDAMGFKVCDADRLAHELMVKGTPVFERIVECFGDAILAEDGEISRPQLGRIVFEDAEKRLMLNRLVHPAVRDELERWISECRFSRANAAVQIPLLYESGMDTLDWDAVICVSCTEPQVVDRLAKRGISRSEAMKRIASQMPLEEKEHLSDRIIYNLGTLQELEQATRSVVERLMVER